MSRGQLLAEIMKLTPDERQALIDDTMATLPSEMISHGWEADALETATSLDLSESQLVDLDCRHSAFEEMGSRGKPASQVVGDVKRHLL